MDVYGFTKSDASNILAKARSGLRALGDEKRELEPLSGMVIGIVQSGGITARASTTAGSGTVTIYYLDGTTITSLSKNITVYNLGTSTFASGDYVTVVQEFISGQWFVSEVS